MPSTAPSGSAPAGSRADAAVDTSTLAYVKDTPGAVSVSFGPVAVTARTTTLTKTVHVVNKRPTGTAAYTIAYQAAHPTPGVTYTFSPSQVNLPAGGSADVKVDGHDHPFGAARRCQDPTTGPTRWRRASSGATAPTPAAAWC